MAKVAQKFFNPAPRSISLWENQRRIVKEAWGKNRALVYSPAGKGKTLIGLTLAHFYRLKGLAKKVLILAPVKGLDPYIRDNVYGFSIKLARTSDDLAQVIKYRDVSNLDALLVPTSIISEFFHGYFTNEKRTGRTILRKEESLASLASLFDYVIVDEFHNFRSINDRGEVTSKVTETLVQFFQAYKGRALFLTATPVFSDILNIWCLWLMVDSSLFPSFWDFYEDYITYEYREIWTKSFIAGRTGRTSSAMKRQIRERTGYKNQDRLMRKLAQYTILDFNEKWTFHWYMVDYLLSPAEESAYQQTVEGLGLDRIFKITIEARGETKMFTRSRTETVNLSQDGQPEAYPQNLRVGTWIVYDDQNWKVTKIVDDASPGEYTMRLPKLQQQLSRTEDKLSKLAGICKDEGALIYCAYKESAEFVAATMRLTFPNRRVEVFTGESDKVAQSIKGHAVTDIFVCTRAITESLSFYFHQIVVYESITSPGMLEQFVGRSSRSDADYTDLRVYVFNGRRTIDSYFWERLVMNVDGLPMTQFHKKLPHSLDWEWIEKLDAGQITFSVLKKCLLWRRN